MEEINNGLTLQWGYENYNNPENLYYKKVTLPIAYLNFVLYFVTPMAALTAYTSQANNTSPNWFAAKAQIVNEQYNLTQFLCFSKGVFWMTLGF